MIILHTGLPGHGKTLFTLCWLKEWAEREKRQVYYHGIPDLNVPTEFPWIKLEKPEEWYSLPPGAIILIDEAQRIFPVRAAGSKVPDHVRMLETHRHGGVDLVLITQHPSLIDSNVRKLTDAHRHVVRAFGANYATVWKWVGVCDQPQKSKKDAEKTAFKYPKDVFSWYKSAELHTVKPHIPKKVFHLVLIISGLICAVLWMLRWIDQKQHSTMSQPATASSGQQQGGGKPQNLQEWLQQQAPRLQGLPHTAPAYDRVTEPIHAPRPAACVRRSTECRCFSQQGTRLDISGSVCEQIAEKGLFQAWSDVTPIDGKQSQEGHKK